MTSTLRNASSQVLLATFSLSFLACGADTESLPQGGLPLLQVEPTTIYFDRIQVGESAARNLSVSNVGSAPLIIEGLDLQQAGGTSFQLSGLGEGQALAPNETVVATISATPDDVGRAAATLTISSNDLEQPEREVLLEAEVVEQIPLVPDSLALDFGLGFGCWAARRSVTLRNPNSDPVLLQNVGFEGVDAAAFRLADPIPMQTILPDGQITLEIEYQHRDSRPHVASLSVQASLRGEPITTKIPLNGAAGSNAGAEERLHQLGTSKIDLLIVIDDSPSMADEQANIRSNVAEFIQILTGFDYQVGVTTTQVGPGLPSGRLLPLNDANNIVRFDDPAPTQQLVNNIDVGLRAQAGVNRGLEAVSRALGSDNGAPVNPGFVRRDALLRVIIISDNDDASARSLVDFRDEFWRLKPSDTNPSFDFRLLTVGGEEPNGCNSTFGSAQVTPRYLEIADLLSGSFLSICNDVWNHSDIFPTTPQFKTRFFLQGSPKPETLHVRVNGEVVPRVAANRDNWSYDPTANAIHFSPKAVPPYGAEILVSYTVECFE